MKAVQALGWYFPESTGGTETYVKGLAAALAEAGIGSVVAAPKDGSEADTYRWEGVRVQRYALPPGGGRAHWRGQAPPPGLAEFNAWLRAEQAQVYHQHSLTTGCGLHHLRSARALGLATVLTVHVPGPVCLRGTMLLEGREPCDGRIAEHRCARCWLGARGAGPGLRAVAAWLPAGLGRAAWGLGRAGSLLGTTALVRQHLEHLLEAASLSDRVVAVCAWLQEALLLNGVPPAKLVLSRQGVDPSLAFGEARGARSSLDPLSIGFLGRWDPVKGLHRLIEAVRLLPPDVPVRLVAHASNPDAPGAAAYRREVERLAGSDPRISLQPPLEAAGVGAFLRSMDVLAVPSQWLETGPLVVLEALAAGTPVLGSRLGGIAELVQDGVQGRLLPHDDPTAWSQALRALRDPGALEALRRGIGPVRTMREAGEETARLYQEILEARSPRGRP